VARIGLVPDHVVVAEFDALAAIAPSRVIAGLGTGDRLSAAENEAYGVPMGTPDERRRSLAACASALVERGITVWVGSGSTRTVALAAELGIALNMWAASPGEVAAQVARSEVTWAGPTPVPGMGPRRSGPSGPTWPAPVPPGRSSGGPHPSTRSPPSAPGPGEGGVPRAPGHRATLG